MSDTDLDEILQKFEWRDLEFKKSSDVSRSAFETVSAFQNTEGGHILLGITDAKEIEGIINVDQVQQTFISGLKDLNLFSTQIEFEEELIKHGDNNVLVFFIPEAARKNKPVYVKTKKKTRNLFQHMYII